MANAPAPPKVVVRPPPITKPPPMPVARPMPGMSQSDCHRHIVRVAIGSAAIALIVGALLGRWTKRTRKAALTEWTPALEEDFQRVKAYRAGQLGDRLEQYTKTTDGGKAFDSAGRIRHHSIYSDKSFDEWKKELQQPKKRRRRRRRRRR